MTPREDRRVEYDMAIAHLLHIPPRDLDRLTVGEFDRACAFVDAWKAQNKSS